MSDRVVRLVQPSGDDTGATDPDNISAQITSLQSDYASRDEVTVVLAGDYYFDEAVAITGTPGVSIVGVNATVTQKTADTYSFTFASSVAYGGCRGIRFVADDYMDDAISVDGCTDLVFEDLDFAKYRRHGVTFDGTCTGSRFDIRTQDAEWAVELLKELTAESRTTYNHTVYSYDATAQAAGATPYLLAGPFFWYEDLGGGSYDRSRVVPADVADGIVSGSGRNSTNPILVDIEEWSPLNEQEQLLRNLRNAVQMWRAGGKRNIGMYRLLPYSDYWTPAKLQRAIIDGNPDESEADQTANIARNMEVNDRTAAALVDMLDYLCVRCYRSYNDDSYYPEWQWYVTLSVMEALRTGKGKPVYPIVYYNDANGDELSEARWIQMLQYVAALPGISGVMVYSGGDAPSGYTWTDAIAELINGTGDFADS